MSVEILSIFKQRLHPSKLFFRCHALVNWPSCRCAEALRLAKALDQGRLFHVCVVSCGLRRVLKARQLSVVARQLEGLCRTLR